MLSLLLGLYMYSGDVLSDEGKKSVNACVNDKIYGKPETQSYYWWTAVNCVVVTRVVIPWVTGKYYD